MRSLLAAAGLAASVVAAPLVADAAAFDQPPVIPFEKYKLDNGLEVILSQDRSLPVVAVNIWYHVGAGDEVAGRTGFAHLFEHMMFTGSKHIPRGKADLLLESANASEEATASVRPW